MKNTPYRGKASQQASVSMRLYNNVLSVGTAVAPCMHVGWCLASTQCNTKPVLCEGIWTLPDSDQEHLKGEHLHSVAQYVGIKTSYKATNILRTDDFSENVSLNVQMRQYIIHPRTYIKLMFRCLDLSNTVVCTRGVFFFVYIGLYF